MGGKFSKGRGCRCRKQSDTGTAASTSAAGGGGGQQDTFSQQSQPPLPILDERDRDRDRNVLPILVGSPATSTSEPAPIENYSPMLRAQGAEGGWCFPVRVTTISDGGGDDDAFKTRETCSYFSLDEMALDDGTVLASRIVINLSHPYQIACFEGDAQSLFAEWKICLSMLNFLEATRDVIDIKTIEAIALDYFYMKGILSLGPTPLQPHQEPSPKPVYWCAPVVCPPCDARWSNVDACGMLALQREETRISIRSRIVMRLTKSYQICIGSGYLCDEWAFAKQQAAPFIMNTWIAMPIDQLEPFVLDYFKMKSMVPYMSDVVPNASANTNATPSSSNNANVGVTSTNSAQSSGGGGDGPELWSFETKRPDMWDVDDVSAWLLSLHLEKLIPKFAEQGVDGLVLSNLDNTIVTDELQVTSVLHKRKLFQCLQALMTRHDDQSQTQSQSHEERLFFFPNVNDPIGRGKVACLTSEEMGDIKKIKQIAAVTLLGTFPPESAFLYTWSGELFDRKSINTIVLSPPVLFVSTTDGFIVDPAIAALFSYQNVPWLDIPRTPRTARTPVSSRHQHNYTYNPDNMPGGAVSTVMYRNDSTAKSPRSTISGTSDDSSNMPNSTQGQLGSGHRRNASLSKTQHNNDNNKRLSVPYNVSMVSSPRFTNSSTSLSSSTPNQVSIFSRVSAITSGKFEMIRVLGRGSFGCAILVKSQEGSCSVIKVVDMIGRDQKDISRSLEEANVMNQLRYPYIICAQSCLYDPVGACMCIQMEYADAGTLETYIEKRRHPVERPIPEHQILLWFTMMALALQHVHSKSVIHRDIKCENMFLTHYTSVTSLIRDNDIIERDIVVKLGDFGLARILDEGSQAQASTKCGTPYNLSPEMVNGTSYSYTSDMWSLGTVLYEMCCLKKPFVGENFAQVVMRIHDAKYDEPPPSLSPEIRGVLTQLLEKDPAMRLSASGILCLPFLAPYIKMCEQIAEGCIKFYTLDDNDSTNCSCK